MAKIPFNGSSYEGFAIDANYQRTVNWYVEPDQSGFDNPILYPTPGLSSFTSAGSGPIRASIVLGTLLYVVSADTLYSVTTGGTATSRGTLTTNSGRCEMAHDGVDILIVDGTDAYVYETDTTTFSTITDSGDGNYDADFPAGATTVIEIDGYFVVNDPNKTNAVSAPGAFFISGLRDALSWNALDYAVAENKWDDIVAIRKANGQLWLVNENSTEVYYNSGNADFPFDPIESAVIEYGSIAGATCVAVDNSIIWLSQTDYGDGQVVRNDGYQITKISTDALDSAIDGYSDISDALAFAYQYKGRTFYVLTFPTADKTWLYDVTTGMWSQWSYNGDDARHLSNCYARFNQTHVVGSATDGQLYTLSATAYDDDGTTITRLRQTPHIHGNGKTLHIPRVHVVFEQGVGTVSVTDPQAMLQWSKDRGHTWGSEQWRDVLGNVGEYSLSSTWRRIGQCESIIFRLKITDAVKAVVVGAYATINTGSFETK